MNSLTTLNKYERWKIHFKQPDVNQSQQIRHKHTKSSIFFISALWMILIISKLPLSKVFVTVALNQSEFSETVFLEYSVE